MLEKIYGIKVSRLIINVSIYFITIIPSYIVLYQHYKVGFWIILILENIVTYYLFDYLQILELIGEEIKSREMTVLSLSTIVGLVMLMVTFIKYRDLFWTIIMVEVIYVIMSRIIKNLRKRPS